MRAQTVAVVGLGYVGLPVAVLARQRGFAVVGIDVDAAKVRLVNEGRCPLRDPPLARRLRRYPILATADPAAVNRADVIIIAVPTPVSHTKRPNLKPLRQALKGIRPHLKAGQILSIESTINPGVMDELVLPLLRQRRGLVLDADQAPRRRALVVVHCPERVNPGDQRWTVRTIPRVIGGYSPAGAARAARFYRQLIGAPVRVMGSAAEAEAVKILENTFRDINIAFVNEMAKSFGRLGIDITEVIAGAATKPFAFLPHYPGNGVGGHCISVDPYYMIERARRAGFNHRFLKLARAINDSMPRYTISLLNRGMRMQRLSPTAPVAILGVAYKKNVADVRESPALAIIRRLRRQGRRVRVFDPYVPRYSTVRNLRRALTGAKALVLATDHDALVRRLKPSALKRYGIKVVVDGKNALPADRLAASDILYLGIGRTRQPPSRRRQR